MKIENVVALLFLLAAAMVTLPSLLVLAVSSIHTLRMAWDGYTVSEILQADAAVGVLAGFIFGCFGGWLGWFGWTTQAK